MSDYIVHKAVEFDALSKQVQHGLELSQDWVVTPKFDGCHVVMLFNNGEFLQALSRTGETAPSMYDVGEAIAAQCNLPQGRLAICGEAWNGVDEFNVISGLFRRKVFANPVLKLAAFDMVQWDYNEETTSWPLVFLYSGGKEYRERLLEDLRVIQDCSAVVYPHIHLFTGPISAAVETFTPYANRLKDAGLYDGAIIAQAVGLYRQGSGKCGEFIKLKPTVSYTVTVTGAEVAQGAKTGKNTAALTFELDGLEQKVSTGLTQREVDEIAVLGWVGKRIEVEAMGKTVGGFLREPRFKGIRTDA